MSKYTSQLIVSMRANVQFDRLLDVFGVNSWFIGHGREIGSIWLENIIDSHLRQNK